MNDSMLIQVDGVSVRVDPAAGRVEAGGRSWPLQVAAGSGQGEFDDEEEE